MASCLQKILAANESRAEGENDEIGIPYYRERSRLNNCCLSNLGSVANQEICFFKKLFVEFLHLNSQILIERFFPQKVH